MRCPNCGHAGSTVIDSRGSNAGTTNRRRRECLECFHRFTTVELFADETPRIVVCRGNHAKVHKLDAIRGKLLTIAENASSIVVELTARGDEQKEADRG